MQDGPLFGRSFLWNRLGKILRHIWKYRRNGARQKHRLSSVQAHYLAINEVFKVP